MQPPQLTKYVAFAVFVFGALIYGPGNALIGHGEHTAHRHHDAANAGAAPPADVPAHCLFCLDGIAPQPTELVAAGMAALSRHAVARTPKTPPRRGYRRTVCPQCRAPPSANEPTAV